MIIELFLIGMVCLVTGYEVKKDIDMNAFDKPLIRYGNPNKYDQAPKGTELLVIKGRDNYELYQQISKDQDNPDWVLRGNLVCQAPTTALGDESITQ